METRKEKLIDKLFNPKPKQCQMSDESAIFLLLTTLRVFNTNEKKMTSYNFFLFSNYFASKFHCKWHFKQTKSIQSNRKIVTNENHFMSSVTQS